MAQMIEGYDRDKGTQHNFTTLSSPMLMTLGLGGLEAWARMLCFDALIGNTDRHQENWEIVSYFVPEHLCETGVIEAPVSRLSPAFDNGTALGYEVIPENINKTLAKLDSYIAKGTHHMKWHMNDEKQQGHFELLANLIGYDPSAKDIMAELLNCDLSALYDRIMELTRYDIRNEHYRLTPERAEFMIALLQARHQKAKETINA